MKNFFLINDDYANSRLDRWLRKCVCNIPQSLIEKNIRKGKIKVNNKKEKSSYKLKKNDKIVLYNFNFKQQKIKKITKSYLPSKNEISSSKKLFVENNENFAIINKPSGIAVQSGTKSKRNILDILSATDEFRGHTPLPVHRIDKDTTGILIVSKSRKYAQLLTTLFRIRRIKKTYLGIICGEFNKEKGTLEDILFYYEGKKKITTKAITHYKVIDSNNNYSFIELFPETGRKHQIRKQLFIRGMPILGDDKYRMPEGKKSKKNNLMLHSYKISFSINDVKYNFSADVPQKFKDTLKQKYLKTF